MASLDVPLGVGPKQEASQNLSNYPLAAHAGALVTSTYGKKKLAKTKTGPSESFKSKKSNNAWSKEMIILDFLILNFGKHVCTRGVEVLVDDTGFLLWFCDRVSVLHNNPELWEWLSQNDDLIISEAMALIEWRGERAA